MVLGVGCRAVALLLVAMFAGLEVSMAAVYKVGDSAGWTIIGNIDYKAWAASKTFHVGDVISKFTLSCSLFCFIWHRHQISWSKLLGFKILAIVELCGKTPAAPPPSAAAPRYALMGLLGKLGLSMAVFSAFLSGFA
ncbi:hypothetical protein LOK49_LG08G03008 [Camellia lanceoleosa]|uniref:Uncharacterized protein n=1 Tax=Camellia lanceoleosa TaxID=1840588 RepID=A0ACC0GWM7_9ERIC|nr:hypothetical protein LOK49_LG08G03008 [Camellia lanceoleosa]